MVKTRFPGVANPMVEVALDGVTVEMVSASCVTNSVKYDVYRRPIAQTDGRGNVTTRAYDVASLTDAAGAVTAYAYDAAGRVAAVTNALGNVVTYGYDVRGNRTHEGDAVYPVEYAYDVFGQKVSMTTYRDETSGEGDSTTWAYDEATGALVAKTYADGRGVSYTLTDLGQVATRILCFCFMRTQYEDAISAKGVAPKGASLLSFGDLCAGLAGHALTPCCSAPAESAHKPGSPDRRTVEGVP